MSKQTPTVLITGFGPFPGAPQNPSQTLVEAMAAQKTVPAAINAKLRYGLLPTHWKNLPPALDELLSRHQPDFSLHLGYSAHSPGFCLERFAYNQTCEQPDVGGVAGTSNPVLPSHPAKLSSKAPLDHILSQLSQAGFHGILSSDPGRYLCNMAYYLSLAHARSSLFVHIPAIQTDAGLVPQDHDGDHQLTLPHACKGLLAIIAALRAQFKTPH